MKTKILLMTISTVLFCGYRTMAQDSLKYIINHDKNVVISVDKVLYTHDKDNFYYLKFTIKNAGKKKIGINLISKQYYSNYWDFGGYLSVESMGNSERSKGRIIQTENDYEMLNNDFANQKLTYISPKKEYSYYINIFERLYEPLEPSKFSQPFRTLLDGQILTTNGKEVSEYRLDNKEAIDRVVIFTQPIIIKKIEEKDNPHIIKIINVTEYEE